MKISIARMIANLAARGRARGNRFAWWSRWFPPATTVDADRFQREGEPYPDHWKEFPRRWPAEVSAATGLSAEQQRDVLNRARELLREHLGRAFERDSHRS